MAVRLRIVFLFVLLLLSTEIIAGNAKRQTIDLCGIWEILPDSNDTGLQESWYQPGYQGNWRPIVVPSAAETVLGTKFDGIAWYRKEFRLPDYGSESHVLLRFGAAATQSRVWVNGIEAGTHTGPWTPFTLDVTQAVKTGEPAVVVVRLDEKVGHSTQGFLPVIAPHFGGLWRGVEVFLVKAVWLDDNRIAIDSTEIDTENGTGILKASVSISGQIPKGAKLRHSLLQNGTVLPQSSVVSVKGEVVQWQWQGKMDFWDVGKPNLYTFQVELLGPNLEKLDLVRKQIGFRKVTGQDSQILLNNKKLIARRVPS